VSAVDCRMMKSSPSFGDFYEISLKLFAGFIDA
jgi:hypothetical protein